MENQIIVHPDGRKELFTLVNAGKDGSVATCTGCAFESVYPYCRIPENNRTKCMATQRADCKWKIYKKVKVTSADS